MKFQNKSGTQKEKEQSVTYKRKAREKNQCWESNKKLSMLPQGNTHNKNYSSPNISLKPAA